MIEENITKNLDDLSKAMQNKILRKAMDKAITPILKEQKSLVLVDTGTLKKSLIKKVSVKNGVAIGYVGARKGNVARNNKIISPTRYAHLVERIIPFVKQSVADNAENVARIWTEEIKKGIAEA